jgi:enoyl-CoA hydratase/carnithine racemase
MSDAGYRVAHAQGVVRITLCRPEAGNKISLPLLHELAHTLSAADADPQVRAVTLQAEGADFCLGRDNSGEKRDGLSVHERHTQFIQPILDFYAAVEHCSVPLVSLVQGRALGFGCALAAACDVTLATDSARFALPEILHGIPPTLAMSALQPMVGRKALMYLVYGAKEVDAFAAQRIGLVSHVVTADELQSEATALITAMASRPRVINAAVKEYARTDSAAGSAISSRLAGLLMAVVRS